MIRYINGMKLTASNLMPDDKVLKMDQELIMSLITLLQFLWAYTNNISDFIEWRAAYYSREIDRKYNL